MNSREIAELATWTAKNIRETLVTSGRNLDDAGEDIIREYVQSELKNCWRGEKITPESSERLVKEILSRRRHETKTFSEVSLSISILSSKFPAAIENHLRERETEAKRLAATMPAIRV